MKKILLILAGLICILTALYFSYIFFIKKNKITNEPQAINPCNINNKSQLVPCKIQIFLNTNSLPELTQASATQVIYDTLVNKMGIEEKDFQIYYTQGQTPYAIITVNYGEEEKTGTSLMEKFSPLILKFNRIKILDQVSD